MLTPQNFTNTDYVPKKNSETNVPIINKNLNNLYNPFLTIKEIWIDNCWFFKSHTLTRKLKTTWISKEHEKSRHLLALLQEH